jgi:hypothetical protein
MPNTNERSTKDKKVTFQKPQLRNCSLALSSKTFWSLSESAPVNTWVYKEIEPDCPNPRQQRKSWTTGKKKGKKKKKEKKLTSWDTPAEKQVPRLLPSDLLVSVSVNTREHLGVPVCVLGGHFRPRLGCVATPLGRGNPPC